MRALLQRLILCSGCLLSVLIARAGYADPATDLASLKERYLKLRNTDVQIKQESDWRLLADQFLIFSKNNPGFPDTPSALINAGILHAELYRLKHEQRDLSAALNLFDRIPHQFPRHALADDALIRLGDLYQSGRGDNDAATRTYLTVLDLYPHGDQKALAQDRLQKLREKKSAPTIATASPTGTPPSEAQKGSGPTIVIDPGHGGEDFGAIGVGGLLEKDMTLAVALALEKLLVTDLKATVRLTRRTDVFVPLAERTNMANDFDADLFISLHGNASPAHKAQGHETYILDNSDEQGSKKLAERENASLQYEEGGQDLQFMLSDLIQSAKLEDSVALARNIQTSVIRQISKKWKDVKDLGVRKGPFYVLVGAHMPCVLVEMFFVDHPIDGARLGKPEFRAELARGIAQGIGKFVGSQKLNSGKH